MIARKLLAEGYANYRTTLIRETAPPKINPPTTTHYTGTQNILKGWCAATRLAIPRLENSRGCGKFCHGTCRSHLPDVF